MAVPPEREKGIAAQVLVCKCLVGLLLRVRSLLRGGDGSFIS